MKFLDFLLKLYAFSYFLLFVYLFVQAKYILEDIKENQKADQKKQLEENK